MVAPPQAVLLVRGSPGEGSTIPLRQGISTLDRSPLSDIIVDHRCASRQHVAIRVDTEGYWIADLGSRNGTYVNGEKLGPEPRRLRNLDRIELGGYAECRWVFMESGETVDMPRQSSQNGHKRLVNSHGLKGTTVGLGIAATVNLFILVLAVLVLAPKGLVRLLFVASFAIELGVVVTWLFQLSRSDAGRS